MPVHCPKSTTAKLVAHYESLNVDDEQKTKRLDEARKKAKERRVLQSTQTTLDGCITSHVSVFHCESCCTKHTPYSVPACYCNATITVQLLPTAVMFFIYLIPTWYDCT